MNLKFIKEDNTNNKKDSFTDIKDKVSPYLCVLQLDATAITVIKMVIPSTGDKRIQ